MNKPIIFCYFENLNSSFSDQSKELIQLWSQSWSDHGWDPKLLSRSDAIKHPDYTEDCWNENSNLILNSNPLCPIYIRACYERWFAYSLMTYEFDVIHWADYDVINYGYNANDSLCDASRFDPSYCCGVLSKEKSTDIINNIVKYAFVDKNIFKKLDLKNNNDMNLLDRLKILPIKKICYDPCEKNVDFNLSKMMHFHGGVAFEHPEAERLNLKQKTRLEIIQEIKPYKIKGNP